MDLNNAFLGFNRPLIGSPAQTLFRAKEKESCLLASQHIVYRQNLGVCSAVSYGWPLNDLNRSIIEMHVLCGATPMAKGKSFIACVPCASRVLFLDNIGKCRCNCESFGFFTSSHLNLGRMQILLGLAAGRLPKHILTQFSMKFAACLSIGIALFACTSARADIFLNYNTTYTQNFDTLASTGTTSTTLPDSPNGWAFAETGTSLNVDGAYRIGTGSSNAGDTYSFGVALTNPITDRAFGELTSGTFNSTLGARFVNNSTNSLTKITTLSYFGEQWRVGSASSDKLDFQISTNATSLTTGTWVNVDALDFTGPKNSPNNSILDGNLAANRMLTTAINIALPTAVSPGQTFWIRWNSLDVGGNDHGLAIDDFSITAIPEPSSTLALGGLLVALGWYARRRKLKNLNRATTP